MKECGVVRETSHRKWREIDLQPSCWLQLALPGWCLVPSFSCMARYRRNARVSLISNAQISVAAIATVALLAAHAQCAAPVARSLNLLTGVPAVLSNVLV